MVDNNSNVRRALVVCGIAALVATVSSAPGVPQATGAEQSMLKPKSRLSLVQIREHVDRQWVQDAATRGLLDYFVAHSVEPNGFIQQNLDRQWKPYGSMREATVNGQGRQLYSMAVGYEMTRSPEYLDALTRGLDFLLKMRDPQHGGYYNRVTSDLNVISDSKAGAQAFAMYSLAVAGRVTGEQRYLDAAMELFRVVRDKMRDGPSPFIGSGSYSRDFMQRMAGGRGGGGRGAGGRGSGAPAGAAPAPATPAPTAAQSGSATGAGAARYRTAHHMFEAQLALYEATRSEEVWYEINQELEAIYRLFDHERGYFSEAYDENWKPVGNPNPGHLFEWASLLSRAVVFGADPKYIALGSKNIDLGIRDYYNHAVGGLGGVNAAGQATRMLWWPQAEVIKATANYAVLHGRTDLWPIYHKTLEFVKREYFDTEHGGWFADFVPGQPRAERGPTAFYKGAVDGPEWGAYHQLSMFDDLWRISNPDFEFWPARP